MITTNPLIKEIFIQVYLHKKLSHSLTGPLKWQVGWRQSPFFNKQHAHLPKYDHFLHKFQWNLAKYMYIISKEKSLAELKTSRFEACTYNIFLLVNYMYSKDGIHELQYFMIVSLTSVGVGNRYMMWTTWWYTKKLAYRMITNKCTPIINTRAFHWTPTSCQV